MTSSPTLVYEVPDLKKRYDNWQTLSGNREAAALCWARARWKEVKLLEGLSLPFLYCTGHPDFKFYDSNGNQATVAGRDVFPMSFLNSVLFLMDSISKQKGNHIVSQADFLKIVQWVDHVDKSFLKRKVSRASKDAIYRSENGRKVLNREFVSQYARNRWFFLKSEWKLTTEFPIAGLAQMDYDRCCDKQGNVLHGLLQFEENFPIIISEPIALETDREKHPKLEYRCWVAGGQLVSASRYLDYDHHTIPPQIEAFAKQFADAHRGRLPDYYVVDIGMDMNKGPLVIELNPISTSGRYIGNDFGRFLKVLFPKIDDRRLQEVNRTIEEEDKKRLEHLV